MVVPPLPPLNHKALGLSDPLALLRSVYPAPALVTSIDSTLPLPIYISKSDVFAYGTVTPETTVGVPLIVIVCSVAIVIYTCLKCLQFLVS